MDVAYLIRRAARSWPDSPAVNDGVRLVKFAEAADRGERFANVLDQLGVPPGASVAILTENRTEYVELDFGIAFGRRVRVALNARLHLDDHRHIVEDADARVLVHSGSFSTEASALSEEFGLVTISIDQPAEGSTSLSYCRLLDGASATPVVRDGDDEDTAWIAYTSGTTGRPKGILLSHRAIREVAFNLLLELDPIRPGQEVVLTQPLSHGSGYFVLPCLLSGAAVYVMRRFDPEEALARSLQPNVELLKIVPAMLPPLVEATAGTPCGFSSVVYGAAPISAPVLDTALESFGPLFIQIYGQSEAPVTLTCLKKEDHLVGEQRFSAGRAWKSVAVEVRDEHGRPIRNGETGEVVVRGPHLMTGYNRQPEATAEVFDNGWLRTRDLGRLDERGFLYLFGRTDDVINSGGFNISPREIELVLTEHPDVEEVAVVGVPDERWGSVVSAVIRLRRGATTLDEDVIEFAKPRLGFRSPKTVTLVDEIPKTAYGKVDRAALLGLFREASA